jgi:hypothetical protein
MVSRTEYIFIDEFYLTEIFRIRSQMDEVPNMAQMPMQAEQAPHQIEEDKSSQYPPGVPISSDAPDKKLGGKWTAEVRFVRNWIQNPGHSA